MATDDTQANEPRPDAPRLDSARLDAPQLTEMQSMVLQFYIDFRHEHRFSPTFQLAANHFHRSRVTILEHVEKLIDKGLLRRTVRGDRAIVPVNICPTCNQRMPGT